MKTFKEKAMKIVFLFTALVSVACVVLICVFLISSGVPAMKEIGFGRFLLGRTWEPGAEIFGIFPMIVGSVYVTGLALLIGVPVALLTAVYLAYFCPAQVYRFIKPAIELLAGIPSVVYGFFGLMVIVPMITEVFGGTGNSLLAVIFILSAMILPTMVSLCETAVRAVPQAYREGSLALGSTDMQTLFKVTLPAAKSGVLNAIVLSIGRAIGETMAVILVCGNRASMPTSILDPVRPMTANIALELSYASGLQERALYATGVVLLVFIVVINVTAHLALSGKKEAR